MYPDTKNLRSQKLSAHEQKSQMWWLATTRDWIRCCSCRFAYATLIIAVHWETITLVLYTREWHSFLPYFCGLQVVLILRWWGGGAKALSKEVHGICNDFAEVARIFVVLPQLSWKAAYERVLIKMALWQRYTLYGPFSRAMLHLLPVWPFIFGRRAFAIIADSNHLAMNSYALQVGPRMLLYCVAGWAVPIVAWNLMHRFFSHRCFSTSRVFATVLGMFCCTSGQTPLYYASIHRRHHKLCDQEGDPHSPYLRGFFYAWIGCWVDRENFEIRSCYVRDWLDENPELLLLTEFSFCRNLLTSYMFQTIFFCLDWCTFHSVRSTIPQRGTSPLSDEERRLQHESQQVLCVLAFRIGYTVALCVTSLVNAFFHDISFWPKCMSLPNCLKRRSRQEETPFAKSSFRTSIDGNDALDLSTDKSRDRAWFWLVGGGEAFHRTHHRFPRYAVYSERWYNDWCYCIYCLLEYLGLIWNVRRPS